MKMCPKCGIEKQLEDFNKNRSQSDGLQITCKPCAKESNRYYNQKKKKEKQKQKRLDDWRASFDTVHGFVLTDFEKRSFYGINRYCSFTERLFSKFSYLKFKPYENGFVRESEYLMLYDGTDAQIVGLVRKQDESIHYFEARFSKYIQQMKKDETDNKNNDEES